MLRTIFTPLECVQTKRWKAVFLIDKVSSRGRTVTNRMVLDGSQPVSLMVLVIARAISAKTAVPLFGSTEP